MFTDVFDENGACVLDEDQDTATLEKSREITTKSKSKRLTLIDALEITNRYIEDTQLIECALKQIRRHISCLARRLDLTRQQACLFATFFGRYDDHHLDMGDIKRHLAVNSITCLRYRDDINVLEQKGLIVSNSDKTWYIPDNVVESICANKKPRPKKQTKLSAQELMDTIGELCCRRAAEEIKFDPFCDEVADILSKNMHLNFSRLLNNYKLGRQSFSLMVWACDMLVNRDDEVITRSDLSRLHEFRLRKKAQYEELVSGQCDLFSLGLIEHCNGGDFKDKDAWKLTNKARTELLSEFDINIKQSNPYEGLINPDSIIAKQLFYNDAEKAQLGRISKLLQENNYKDVTSRLKKSGFNTGFTVLLSGPAGTGKTEFVQQIAKATGRHILSYKISDILDSYVGESEKNLQRMFDRYFSLVDRCEVTPILFLDEMDSLCSRRFKNPSRSSDQSFNNMQALFLQNLNKFKGILIGTTNMTENMNDPAIERRFLLKTRIELPSAYTRKQIWHSFLPKLSEDLLKKASSYEFSGGKIENVVRKIHLSCALDGTDPDEAMVLALCNEENVGYGKSNVIGF